MYGITSFVILVITVIVRTNLALKCYQCDGPPVVIETCLLNDCEHGDTHCKAWYSSKSDHGYRRYECVAAEGRPESCEVTEPEDTTTGVCYCNKDGCNNPEGDTCSFVASPKETSFPPVRAKTMTG